jgi:putative membrane protein
VKRYADIAVVLVCVIGLAIAAWAFAATGFDNILAAARRIGIAGFLLYCLYSLGVFGLLGAAWLVAIPAEPATRVGRFVWARMVREAASDLLPFSQIGGLIVSTRMLVAAGVETSALYASLIVDLTTEMASQLVFTVAGIASIGAILTNGGHDGLRTAIVSGGIALLAIVAGIVFAQRPALALAGRMAQHLLPGSIGITDAIGAALAAVYRRRARVALSFALNLAAWIASAAGAWIVLHLIGADPSIRSVLALESMIFMLRSVAFAIPGGIGVQEAGYALLAPHVGLPADAVLALAIAKRARDLAIGVPTLALWQMGEIGSLLPSRVGRRQ